MTDFRQDKQWMESRNDISDFDIEDKFILDACCGAKQMWYDKNHPNTIYIDIREEEKGFSNHEKKLEIKPDYKSDFTKLPFKNKQFKLIVFDPPHKKHRNVKGIFDLKYGNLKPETWQSDLEKGFKELWRVLDDYGILIFKWNESEIKLKEVLNLFFIEPLFGNKTGLRGKTVWSCFMKIPKEANK